MNTITKVSLEIFCDSTERKEKTFIHKKLPFIGLFISMSLIILAAGGCKSYKVVPNGFIVQGDDNFVSVNERLSVTIGSSLLTREIWQKNSPPLKASSPTSEQTRVLRKLGYDKKNYTIVFTSSKNLPFQIIGLVNTFPLNSERKTPFFNIGKLNKIETDFAKWYDEIQVIGGDQVYHTIVPVSEKLFAEKYLSIIYFDPSRQYDLKLIEEIVRINAEKYRTTGQQYLPMKTVESCAGETEVQYFDYTVPEVVKKHDQYALIKAFSDEAKTNLVYYSLLEPEQSLGSFKLCEGKYFIEYTTLDGLVLWNEETNID